MKCPSRALLALPAYWPDYLDYHLHDLAQSSSALIRGAGLFRKVGLAMAGPTGLAQLAMELYTHKSIQHSYIH